MRVVRTFAAQTGDELRIVFARADKNPSCGAAATSPGTSVIMETSTLGETPQWGRVKIYNKNIFCRCYIEYVDTTKLNFSNYTTQLVLKNFSSKFEAALLCSKGKHLRLTLPT